MTNGPIYHYILLLDSSDTTLNFEGMGQYIKDASFILGWANHVPYVFFLKTQLPLRELGVRLRKVAGGARHMLFETDYSKLDGWMNMVTWNWFAAPPVKPALDYAHLFSPLLDPPKT